jgi:hypothetical protein
VQYAMTTWEHMAHHKAYVNRGMKRQYTNSRKPHENVHGANILSRAKGLGKRAGVLRHAEEVRSSED